MNKTMNLDTGDNMLCVDNSKPLVAITELIDALTPELPLVTIAKSKIIRYTENNHRVCYILHKGSIALHRRGDGIVMSSETAPFIFGLSNQLNITDTVYLRTLEMCEISVITLSETNQFITQRKLWESLTKLLIYTMGRVYEHCTQVHQMSAYDIIRFQLNELANESEEVRMKTTVANYIKTRTYLSRSGIMRILAELRTGGYIHIEKGVLQSISYLPKKY